MFGSVKVFFQRVSLFYLPAVSIFFFVFFQRALYYVIDKIFFRRTVAVTWKCSEKRCLKYLNNLRDSGTGVFL